MKHRSEASKGKREGTSEVKISMERGKCGLPAGGQHMWKSSTKKEKKLKG